MREEMAIPHDESYRTSTLDLNMFLRELVL